MEVRKTINALVHALRNPMDSLMLVIGLFIGMWSGHFVHFGAFLWGLGFGDLSLLVINVAVIMSAVNQNMISIKQLEWMQVAGEPYLFTDGVEDWKVMIINGGKQPAFHVKYNVRFSFHGRDSESLSLYSYGKPVLYERDTIEIEIPSKYRDCWYMDVTFSYCTVANKKLKEEKNFQRSGQMSFVDPAIMVQNAKNRNEVHNFSVA